MEIEAFGNQNTGLGTWNSHPPTDPPRRDSLVNEVLEVNLDGEGGRLGHALTLCKQELSEEREGGFEHKDLTSRLKVRGGSLSCQVNHEYLQLLLSYHRRGANMRSEMPFYLTYPK